MGVITDIAAQRLIDDEISRTEDRTILRELKTRRNTYSAIFSLPDDVLSPIFIHSKENLPFSHSIIVDQVCSHWRAVALSTPQMWSDIKLSDFSREAWPSMKIQRSKFVPLSLDLRIPSHALPPESNAFWALVHQIIARKLSIHQLSLTIDTPRILAHFFALATKNDQPLLHSLSIFNSSHSLGEKGLHLWQGLPNLKSLTLYNVQMFDLDTLPFLPRLVNFHATGPTYEHPITVPWLVRALSSMPAIETVYVHNLRNGGALAETLSVPITIPSLQKLDIVFQDSNLGASRIFDYLDIPASSISCLIEPSPLPMHMVTMAHAPLVASLFAHWIQTFQEAKPLELRLAYSFDVVLSIGSPNRWRKIALSYRQVPSNLRLTLFDLLPLDAFTTMSFIHTHPNSSTELTKLLPRFIALRQIIFGIYSANTIECLFKKPSDDSPHLPNLERLDLSSDYLSEIGTLEALVRERQQYGMPIKSVTFRGRHARATEMTTTLRTLVEVDFVD